ncbi:MAG: hypothetical protein QM702_03670 [Rubrivivax sp.]
MFRYTVATLAKPNNWSDFGDSRQLTVNFDALDLYVDPTSGRQFMIGRNTGADSKAVAGVYATATRPASPT